MKRTLLILCALLAMAYSAGTQAQNVWNGTVAENFAGGSGTAEEPYLIADGAQLARFASMVNNGLTSINGRLTADILLNDTEGWETWNESTEGLNSWTPIGSSTNRFSGTLDGDGHSVSGIYINNTADYQGLVGYLGSGGTLQNLGVKASYIKGGWYVGGLCGANSGNVTNCYNTGNVTGDYCVGGLCGTNNGTMTNCYNTGSVTGGHYVGGVCGRNGGGTVNNCYNTGSVTGGSQVGGVCGRNEFGTVTNCYYLTGKANSGIGEDYNSGEATEKSADEFASGEVAWLLQGEQEGQVWGQTIGTDEYPVLGGEKVLQIGNGYVNELKQDGDGFYLISNANELRLFASMVNGGQPSINGKLTADILLNDTEGWETWNESTEGLNSWTPIGSSTNRFSGTLDGAGHSVSGIYINNTADYQGLVGYLGSGGTLQNLGVKASYIKGGYYYVGGLCGYNYSGTVTNCYNTGNVTGSNAVGGVCGTNNGTVTNCYNTGSVTGSYYVGGVCGQNYGTMTNCYNTGSVTGNMFVGGVCGANYRTVTNCYYLTGKAAGGIEGSDADEQAEAKTAEQFQSGEVAWLLSTGENGEIWGQNISFEPKDSYPVLGGLKVVQNEDGTSYKNELSQDGDFYLISTADELRLFASMVNGGLTSINGKLTADILLNDISNWESWDESTEGLNSWTPIGSGWTNPFTGTLDGDGHSVSGIYINNSEADYQGLVGYLGEGGTLQNVGVKASYIKGSNRVGGLCGENDGGIVTNCYNTGSVTGNYCVGGLCGQNDGTMTNCYNTGKVAGTNWVGGLCGYNGDTVTNCYYLNTCGAAGEGTSKTADEFASGEVAWLLGEGWGQTIGTDEYPVLGGEKVYQYSDGTYGNTPLQAGEDGFYLISNADELRRFADMVNGGQPSIKGRLTANILLNDISGWENWDESTEGLNSWTPIGSDANQFTGILDGDGHSVSGIYINNTADYQGLVGYLGSGGTLQNLGVKASYIKGGYYVAGLCGWNDATVTNCYNTGSVTGTDYVGGVCGMNMMGTVTNCYNTGSVTGRDMVGGVCGVNFATVTNCYYLDTCGAAGDGTSKTAEQFQSGEVAWLLGEGWGQTIDTDEYPVWQTESNKVYKLTLQNGDEANALYANSGNFTLPAPAEVTGYTFAGWFTTQADGTQVQDNATLTADLTLYAQWTANSYTVTFEANGGKGSMNQQTFTYGVAQTLTPNTFTRTGYSFTGWNTQADGNGSTYLDGAEVQNLTTEANGSITLYAQWSINSYTIRFVNADGTELQSSEVEYGQMPTYNAEIPTKESTAEFDYAFAGWTPDIAIVTGDATYTATYTATKRSYTITFVDEDGTTVLQSSEVEYGQRPAYNGETPTKASTAEFDYTFAGWDPELASVTGDATYTATYTETRRSYTITFVDEDGTTVLQSSEVEYGQRPAYNGETPTKESTAEFDYTFAGWTPDIASVTGDATYTATYTETRRSYTITFVDEDGTTVLQSSEVEYGQTPAYNGETPTKESTAEFDYAFAGWDPEIAIVTGDATYTATYTETRRSYTVTLALAEGCEDMGEVAIAPAAEGNRYEYGTEATLTATAYQGYKFVKWSDGDTNATRTITVTGDLTFTATFTATDPTALHTPEAGTWKAIGTDGMLRITGTAAEAGVHDVRGVLVYRGMARTLHVTAGAYIVRIGNEVQKAVVK